MRAPCTWTRAGRSGHRRLSTGHTASSDCPRCPFQALSPPDEIRRSTLRTRGRGDKSGARLLAVAESRWTESPTTRVRCKKSSTNVTSRIEFRNEWLRLPSGHHRPPSWPSWSWRMPTTYERKDTAARNTTRMTAPHINWAPMVPHCP